MRGPATERLAAGNLGGRARLPAHRRASKFGAERAESQDGRRFASKAERDRYEELRLLEAAGEIRGLTCQPSWHFPINGVPLTIGGRKVRYTADFLYVDCRAGTTVVEDVKGVMTRDAVLRIALMRAVHGIEVRIVRPRRRR
jgi:hypothetical protein